MAQVAGVLEIQMRADLARLVKDMNHAKRAVTSAVGKINSILQTIGVGISLVGFVQLIRGTINAADAMRDLQLKTGLAYKDLAAFKLIADQSGSSVEGVANAVKFLSKYMVEHSDKLKSIGVTSKDVNGALRQFADTISKIQDPALRTALAVEILGKQGMEMIPVLIGGAAAIEKAEERTRAYTKALEEAAPQADQFNDYIAEAKIDIATLGLEIANTLLPTLLVLSEELKKTDGAFSDMQESISVLLDVGIKALSVALESLVLIGSDVSFVFGRIGNNIGAVAAASVAAANLEFAEARKILQLMRQDDEKARAALDEFQQRLTNPPKTAPKDAGITSDKGLEERARLLLVNNDAAKKAAEAAEKFVEALKREYDMLGMTVAEQKRYAVENAKLPPLLRAQALAMVEVGEAKREQLRVDQEAQKEREKRLESLQQELKSLQQQTEEYKLSALAIAELNVAKAGGAFGAAVLSDPTNSVQIVALQTELALRQQILQKVLELSVAAAQLESLAITNQALSDSAQGLAQAFGNVGQAIGGMTTSLAAFSEAQKKNNELVKLGQRDRSLENQLRLYGDLASSAKHFFKEGSKGYKAMEAAEKVYRVFQFAMAAKEMIIQAWRLIAPGAATAANVASVPGFVAAEEAKATAAGTTAAAEQATAGPIVGFVMMAAMIVALIAIGVKMKGGGGKVDIAAQRQARAGVGSVFGDASAKSESIANSIKILEENSFKDLEYTNAMLEALRAIQNNIEGLVNIVIRRLGLPGGAGDTSGLGLGKTTTSSMPSLPGADNTMMQMLSHGNWAIFAKKVSVELIDYGVLIVSQSLSEIIEKGLQAFQYQTIETTTKKFFGLSKKKKISEIVEPLDDEFANQFTMIILGIRDAVLSASEVLGIFGNDLSDFVIDIGHISLSGMTGEEIQEQFEAIFSKLGDDMAKTIFPAVTEFAKIGEGAMETLTRLARDYQIVDLALKSIGQTFTLVGVASIEARERLIDLSGGIEDFIEQAQAFAQTFLNDVERGAPVLNAVLAELGRLGIMGVYTKDAFKNLILSLDLTTEEGAALYAALMKLGPAFASAVDAVHDAVQRYFDIMMEAQRFQFSLQQKIAGLSGGGGGAAMLEAMGRTLIEQYNVVTTTLEDKIAILNQLSGLVDQWMQQRMADLQREKQAVQDAANLRLDALNKELAIAQQWVGVLNSAKQMLDQMRLTTTNPLPTSGRLNLASIEVARLQQQLGSAAPEERAKISQQLLEALQKQLSLAQEFYQRPSPEYQAIYNSIIKQVSEIEAQAQEQADEALRIQKEISALQEATVAQLKAIDAQAQAIKDQAAAWYAQIAAEGARVYEELKKQAEEDLLALADAAGQRDNIIAILAEINAKIGGGTLPSAAGGLLSVPYDNYAVNLHKGERVLTAGESREYGSGGGLSISMPMTFTNVKKEDAQAIVDVVDKRVMQLVPVIKRQLKRA